MDKKPSREKAFKRNKWSLNWHEAIKVGHNNRTQQDQHEKQLAHGHNISFWVLCILPLHESTNNFSGNDKNQ